MGGIPAHEPQTPEQKREERIENIIAVLVMVAIVVVAAILMKNWYDERHNPRLPDDRDDFHVSAGDDPMLGDPAAPVMIIEFSDYGCAMCGAFARDTFPRLKQEYIDTGKAKFVYRDYPIEQLHSESLKAAAAATCAGDQGKYWEFHEALYANQSRIGSAFYNETAESLGLDMARFQRCVSTGMFEDEARLDYFEGLKQGDVISTPTFFVNTKRIRGNLDYQVFTDAIDEALKAQ